MGSKSDKLEKSPHDASTIVAPSYPLSKRTMTGILRNSFGYSFSKSKRSLGLIAVLLSVFMLAGWAPLARAQYYPDHPVVKEMVDKAVKYLSNADYKGDAASSVGMELLAAYTIYKVEGDPDHPMVARGLGLAKNFVDKTVSARSFENKTIYHLAISCMLLASVSVDTYSPQLINARDFFFRNQQVTGGFGYIDGSHKSDSGDISQTQYVLLALWTMSQLGIEIPEDRIIRTLGYLYEAQIKDPAGTTHGGWPYQFEPDNKLAKISTNSLTACGLSSVLIAGDILGLFQIGRAHV